MESLGTISNALNQENSLDWPVLTGLLMRVSLEVENGSLTHKLGTERGVTTKGVLSSLTGCLESGMATIHLHSLESHSKWLDSSRLKCAGDSLEDSLRSLEPPDHGPC